MSWLVVVPFKGAPGSKSRLAGEFDDAARAALALAFLHDTVTAVRGVAQVAGVVVVSNEPGLSRRFDAAEALAPARAQAPVEVIADPGDGLNAAIAAGIARFRTAEPAGHVAVLLGDLPALVPAELGAALRDAQRHPLAFVTDAAGTGTTMITLAPGVSAEPMFGPGSAAAHGAAGFVALEQAETSGLRRDVDSPADLRALLPELGPRTRAALAALDR